jgi:hypothetical protein
VGEGPATEFLTYYQMAIDLIDVDEVIRNPNTAAVPNNNPGALYALTTSLAGRSRFENITAVLTYLNRIPIEFAVYCVSLSREVERGRVARMTNEENKKNKKMRENKSFTDWCIKHHALIVE